MLELLGSLNLIIQLILMRPDNVIHNVEVCQINDQIFTI